MSSQLVYEPLDRVHVDELAALLANEQVYAYIGGQPPTVEQFRRRTERVLAGPPPTQPGVTWINYVVRLGATGRIVGRLEATTHDDVAEVAFLFGPQHWGKGYATQGLLWLNGLLLGRQRGTTLWATTDPRNARSRALLARCGYRPVQPGAAPRLFGFEEGDLVFKGPGAA